MDPRESGDGLDERATPCMHRNLRWEVRVADLGALVRRYRPDRGKRVAMLIVCGVGQVFFTLAVLGGLMATVSASDSIAIFIAAATAGAVWFWLNNLTRLQRWLRVSDLTLYEHGLNSNRTHLRWDELREILIDIVQINIRSGFSTVASEREYRVVLTDEHGTSLEVFEPGHGVEALIGVARAAVLRNVLPDARRRLIAGNEVIFGKLSMSKKGVLLEGQLVSLDRITEVEVRDGLLVIKHAGELLLRLREIPNYDVLLSLLDDRAWWPFMSTANEAPQACAKELVSDDGSHHVVA